MKTAADPGESLARIMPFVAALIDPDRLRIAGMLAEQPLTRLEIIERTGLNEADVHKHLMRLEQGGVIRQTDNAPAGVEAPRRGSMYAEFELDRPALHALGPIIGRLQGRPAQRPTEDRARVLATFFDDDGRLMSFPVKPGPFLWVLEAVTEHFEAGREYPEREVNALLKPIHEDFATMRRALVDHGLMSRANGIYRREWFPTEETAPPAEA